MSRLFRRKPIAALMANEGAEHSLKRVLGAGDLVMLAIGAVIGAGIFGAIGTAAAGQTDPGGAVIRYGAGPALVFSFLLLGGACALAALCYAELASMIPQAGSAYAYCYATLGEFIAWIVGWDLILEYAVGNVAVAISWSDYFTTLVRGFGLDLPVWLTTGYRTAALSANPAVHALVDTAPRVLGLPLLVNLPAFGIVLFITWLLLRGVRESTTANNAMVVVKLLALGLFVAVGVGAINPANYEPFAPNGFTGVHQGAAIVFFAYIGFDAISTAAEETINPQRNLPIGILGGLAVCTLIYVIVGAVLTGLVPYQQLAVADPLARALEIAGFTTVGWVVALGAAVSMAAVLLVFQVRPAADLLRDGPRWLAAPVGGEGAPAHARALRDDVAHRRPRVGRRGSGRRGRNLRSHQHRHALRVRAGVRGRTRAPGRGARAAPALPRTARLAGRAPGRRRLRLHHDRPAVPGLGALRPVAGRGPCRLFRVWLSPFAAASCLAAAGVTCCACSRPAAPRSPTRCPTARR